MTSKINNKDRGCTEVYKEQYRPQFHFTPKKNWLNDPNGMVFYNGEYHLFFQYHPFDTQWGPMHWGHATSSDLIHWEEQACALYPDEHGTIFSGSAVVDRDDTTGFFIGGHGLVAIYTQHKEQNDVVEQVQSLAYSNDNGRTWIKYKNNPVLANKKHPDFRDPKVFWHEKSKRWIMVISCGQVIHFYSSTNLIEWIFLSEFGEGYGEHYAVWECPDLFELPIEGTKETKWVLIVSIGDNENVVEGSRTQYFIGDFDGKTFTSDYPKERVLWLDRGRDNYAGVSWSDIPVTDGRRIYIAWMSNWKYAGHTPTGNWRGAMTLPRTMSLVNTAQGIRIKQQVVEEMGGIIDNIVNFINSETVFISLKIEDDFALALRTREEPELSISYANNKVTVERLGMFQAKDEIDLDTMVNMKIYLDTSSVELFINDGLEAFTYQIFPKGKITDINLQSTDKNYVLEIHEIKSIW